MIQRKICMLGAFAVGKTSLVARYVQSVFSEKYHTTVGVKIDKKTVSIDGTDVMMILWDLHGEDAFQTVRMTYMRGSAGFLLVADGTRGDTLQTAIDLQTRAEAAVGSVPFIFLVNKSDLMDDWEISAEDLAALEARGWTVIHTSAKTGEGVEEAFEQLSPDDDAVLMADLPPSVRKHVYDLVLQARSPAFLEVSGSGLLRGAGGDLSRYGLADLPANCSVTATVPFLLGLLPVPRGSDPLFLPSLEVRDGSVADVLIVEDQGEAWVVLLDATESHDKRQALQQSANDLALLKQKIARILSDRTSGRARTESTEAAAFREKGDRRDVAVARLEVFLLGDPDGIDAEQLTLSADTLISRVSSALREAGGLTEVSMGGSVTSVFGLIHGQSRPADLAVTKTLGLLGREMCGEGLSLRAGVASGRSVVALVQKEDTRYLQTLGDPVSTASRLAASADSGEVLIDAPSFRNVEAAKNMFRPSGTISCPDGSTVDLYSSTPK